MINLLRKIVERHDEKVLKRERVEFLRAATEPIHIANGFDLLCRAHSTYAWEEDAWEFTPYVYADTDEEKYATCPACLATRKKKI